MKIIIISIFFGCFSLLQIRASEVDEKETLPIKVSFLLVKEHDSIFQKEFLLLKKLYKKSKYPETLEKGLALLKKEINLDLRFKITFIIAEIYRKNNNSSKSIEYYKQSLNLKNEFTDNKSQFYKSNKFCNIFLKLGNEFLKNKLKDSAVYYYNKTLNFSSVDLKSLSYQASASNNLSGIYMRDSLYDKAKEFAIKAVEIHKKRNNKISEAAAKGNLANIYLAQDNFKEAKKTYKEALALIKYNTSSRAIRVKEDLYYNLAYNLYKLKDYEAYVFQELSYDLKDSLRDKEYRKMIEEVGFKYNFEVKKELFQKQEENKRLRDQTTFVIIGIFTLVIIISLVYWLNFFKLKQRNLALKLSKSELIQNQKLDKLKSDTQTRILDATLNGKETERREIAETLHDSVSALLSAATLHLQATRKKFKINVPVEIDKTQEILEEASQQIRDLSHVLMSSVLLKFGLNLAIKDLAGKYSNSNLTIHTDIRGIRKYQQNFEIKVYNMIQEFLNNIFKHSRATKATIKLIEEKGFIVIEITDNGIGFDKTKITLKDGLGINQIDARIHMMKGYFYINSSKGKGTIIDVKLPIVEKKLISFS